MFSAIGNTMDEEFRLCFWGIENLSRNRTRLNDDNDETL